jgi:hypothetical protein
MNELKMKSRLVKVNESPPKTSSPSLPPYQCPQNLPFQIRDPLTESQQFWKDSTARKKDQLAEQEARVAVNVDPLQEADQAWNLGIYFGVQILLYCLLYCLLLF